MKIMIKSRLTLNVSYLAIAGNVLFIFWIMFNAMDEGFKGTLPEKISFFAMIALLAANAILLHNQIKNNK